MNVERGTWNGEPDYISLFAFHLQSHQNIPRFYLLRERHLPEVGRAAAAVVQAALAAAQLGRHLLAIDKGEHPLVVGTLQGIENGELRMEIFYFGEDVVVEMFVEAYILVDDVGGEQGQDAVEAVAGYEQLGGHNLVAQADGLAQQRAVVVHREQALVGGIAGVEQAHVHLTVGLPEVIAQHAIVEQQLHIVALQLQAVAVVALELNLRVAARLLLYQEEGNVER